MFQCDWLLLFDTFTQHIVSAAISNYDRAIYAKSNCKGKRLLMSALLSATLVCFGYAFLEEHFLGRNIFMKIFFVAMCLSQSCLTQNFPKEVEGHLLHHISFCN